MNDGQTKLEVCISNIMAKMAKKAWNRNLPEVGAHRHGRRGARRGADDQRVLGARAEHAVALGGKVDGRRRRARRRRQACR